MNMTDYHKQLRTGVVLNSGGVRDVYAHTAEEGDAIVACYPLNRFIAYVRRKNLITKSANNDVDNIKRGCWNEI